MASIETSRALLALALLLFVGGAVLFAGADDSLLYRYDDAFFAETAREVASEGNWLDLRTRGAPMLEKPPVTFWLEAVAIRFFGPGSAAVRAPGSLLFLGTTILVWFFLRRWRGESEAIVAALIILTSHQLVFYARRPVNEIYTVCWSWLLALCYLHAFVHGGAKSRALGGLVLGVAFMTKGIMAFVAVVPLVLHALWERQFIRVFRHRATIVAGLLFLAAVVPWHARMLGVYGESFRDIYIWQTQLSFIVGTSHSDPWSADVILRKIAETWWPWLLPWVVALVVSVKRLIGPSGPRARSVQGIADVSWIRFLWVWFGFILLIFHLVYVKRDRYVLPAYPAMAMLAGWWIVRARAARWWKGAVLAVCIGLAGFAVIHPAWPLIADYDHYGDRTGALLDIIEGESRSPVLVYDPGEGYCFSCDTIAFYAEVDAQPYSRQRLVDWSHDGPARLFVTREHLVRKPLDLPPGLDVRAAYSDPRAAVFEIWSAAGAPGGELKWPEPVQSEWPGNRASAARRARDRAHPPG